MATQTLTQKLIAVLDKGKDIDEKMEAYVKLGEHLHKEFTERNEKLVSHISKLPKKEEEKK